MTAVKRHPAVAGVLLALALFVGAPLVPQIADAVGETPVNERAVSTEPMPAGLSLCSEEDGSGAVGVPCRWDQGLQGDGTGRNFWIDADGETQYLD